MGTRRHFKEETIRKDNERLSPLKALVETAFYKNNVIKVKTMQEDL